ncbi:MAG: surface glycoprotein, partial [Haloplanus sp.]
MTDYNDKFRAVILAALMVLSVFAGTIAFSGTAVATDAVVKNNTQLNPSPNAGDEAAIQRITLNDTNGGDGEQVVIDTVSLSETGGGALTASDIDQVELLINDTGGSVTSVASTNPSSLSSITFSDLDSSTGNWSNSGSNLLLDDGKSGRLEIQVTLATSAAAQGDQVTFNTTLTLTSGNETFSGSTTATRTSGTLSLGQTAAQTAGSDNRALNADGSGNFNTQDGTGYVFEGATVFQGESGISLGGQISGGVVKTAGNAEGVPLEVPDVPQNQETGRYTTDGQAGSPGVTVQQPRVTT